MLKKLFKLFKNLSDSSIIFNFCEINGDDVSSSFKLFDDDIVLGDIIQDGSSDNSICIDSSSSSSSKHNYTENDFKLVNVDSDKTKNLLIEIMNKNIHITMSGCYNSINNYNGYSFKTKNTNSVIMINSNEIYIHDAYINRKHIEFAQLVRA